MALFFRFKPKFLGSLIGGIIQRKQGIKKANEGRKLLSESDNYFPALEDAEQRGALNRIRARANNLYSGSYASALSDNMKQQYANMQQGALSLASGGGADVTAMMRSGNMIGQNFNQTIGALEQQGFQYEQESQRRLEDIVQRQLELNLMKHQEKRYDANSMIAAGDMQKNAGSAAIMSGMDSMVNTAVSMGTGAFKSMLNKKNNTNIALT